MSNGNGAAWIWKVVLGCSLTLNVALAAESLITRNVVTGDELKEAIKSALATAPYPWKEYERIVLGHMDEEELHEGDRTKRDRIKQVLKAELDGRLTAIEKNQELHKQLLERIEERIASLGR